MRSGLNGEKCQIGAALGGITPNAVACQLAEREQRGLAESGRAQKRRSLRITEAGLRLLGISCPYCNEVGHGS